MIAITKNAIAKPVVTLVITKSAPRSFCCANKFELWPVKAFTIPSDLPLCNRHNIISAIESDVLSGQNNVAGANSFAENMPVLYEKMLKTAVTAPERFVEIEKR